MLNPRARRILLRIFRKKDLKKSLLRINNFLENDLSTRTTFFRSPTTETHNSATENSLSDGPRVWCLGSRGVDFAWGRLAGTKRKAIQFPKRRQASTNKWALNFFLFLPKPPLSPTNNWNNKRYNRLSNKKRPWANLI